jgi:plastocyanin
MRLVGRAIVIGLVATAVAGCGSSAAPRPPDRKPAPDRHPTAGVNAHIRLIDISIRRGRLVPPLVAVRRGVPIMWTNRDSRVHTVRATKSSPQQFDSGPLKPGETFRISALRRGRLTYRVTGSGDSARGVVVVG